MSTSKQQITLDSVPNGECKLCKNKTERKQFEEDALCSEASSAIDKLPVPCVGEWAYDKIYRLVQYFGIFAQGMHKRWNGGINYIEICSGPGRCILRERGEEINGTALAVLKDKRFHYVNQALGQPNDRNGFKTTCHPDVLEMPLRGGKPQMIFVNSMSDLFHKEVPAEFIDEIFFTMNETPWHTYQVLTKRAGCLAQLASRFKWTPNIWMGVTVENVDYVDRIDHLRDVPTAVRFLSLEPLLGPLPDLNLDKIDWVIVGGESGPGARPMDPAWATELRDQCLKAKVPFFFKQWGGVQKKKAGRLLEKKTWNQMPA